MPTWSKRFIFPYLLVLIHTVLTIWVFAEAVRDFSKAGMLPILIFTIDIPVSYLILLISRTLSALLFSGYRAELLNDMAFFLMLGSIWWFGIGYASCSAVSWGWHRLRFCGRVREQPIP